MIVTQGLSKRFGAVQAVQDLALEVNEGDIYGFLGANGSGKTTTVRMLLGLVLPTTGSISIMGQAFPQHAVALLPQIGAMVEGPAAYPHLSGRANLALFDAMATSNRVTRRNRIEEALTQVGLVEVDARPVRAYSLGMRQRLGLAHALLQKPRLLILDEPTNGLDPQGIREIRALLVKLRDLGTTIFLSSHLISEVQQLCTRIGVLDQGKMVVQDNLENLVRLTGRYRITTPDLTEAHQLLGSRVEDADANGLIIRVSDPATVNHELVSAGIRVTSLEPERRTLEELVLELIEQPGVAAS
jgi:ABC-type multidrug transport system ATPase subunit